MTLLCSLIIKGYYTVYLESHDVFVELTAAGLYTGVHRYTFNDTEGKKYLLFDITHSVQEV
jgi:putative alpha-1,2-mannosidase